MKAISIKLGNYRMLFARGSFGHNVLIMFIGTALGQFGSVLLAPALTRIYPPETFGILGVFTALLTILCVIASLRYEMALPLTHTPEDTANLLSVTALSLVITTLITVAMLWIISLFGSNWGVFQMLQPYRLLLPVGFFCMGAYQILIYYATQRDAFGIIARTKVYQGLSGPLTQIGLGLAGAGVWGLIIGFIVGQSTGSTLLFSRLVLKSRQSLCGISLDGMRTIAKRFSNFPLISSWSGLINAAGTSYLLLVVVPILYSNTIAGFIFLTDRVIGRPLLLISTSILQVYVGEASKVLAVDPKQMRQRFLQLARYQLAIVSTWLILVNLLAPTLFPIVFGDEWQGAVPYLHVLSIAYLAQMVLHALVHTLQILERQALSAAWETGRLLAIIVGFAASYNLGLNALQALLVYSIVQAIAQIILFIFMYQSIQSLQKGQPDE